MKNIFLKMAVIASMLLAVVSCQQDNELDNLVEEQSALQEKPQLPEVINISSATHIADDELSLAKRGNTNISIDDVTGTYIGVLHNVNMNGKDKDDVQNIPIHILKTSSDKFTFIMDPFQVGKMPGKLSVEAKNIKLKSNGDFYETLSTNSQGLEESVSLKIGFFKSFKYNTTLIEGKFTAVSGGHKLEFTLESEGSIWTISLFKAHVEYEGNK